MSNNKTEWKSKKTGRSYKIKRHYTCATSHCIYVGECLKCKAQYIGQTRQPMSKRHYGHRQEVKGGLDGFGEHFKKHAEESGLNVNKDMDEIMKWCSKTIVASVEQGKSWTNKQLDRIEGDLQDRIMTFYKQGGINRRDERKRGAYCT